MNLTEWAQKHHISPSAILDFYTMVLPTAGETELTTEADAQRQVRERASSEGWRLWRNNVGAGKLDSGRFVRFGLANESEAMNKSVKSSDLIGIKPVLVTPEHIGQRLGVFVSREVKKPGWRYTGTGREVAQMKWITIVSALGGDAKFTTGEL